MEPQPERPALLDDYDRARQDILRRRAATAPMQDRRTVAIVVVKKTTTNITTDGAADNNTQQHQRRQTTDGGDDLQLVRGGNEPNNASPSTINNPAMMSSTNSSVLRVFQLDGERMDSEVVNLLHKMISEGLQPLSSVLANRWHDEVRLFLSLALYRLSTWTTLQSYGDKLQNLVYRDEHKATVDMPLRISVATTPSKTKRLLHLVLSIVVPYLMNKLQKKILDESWAQPAPENENAQDLQDLVDQQNRVWISRRSKRIIARVLAQLEAVYLSLELGNFLLFLLRGDYRSVIDRFLGMRLVYGKQMMFRMQHLEYQNQQVFWSVMFTFVSFIMPFVNLGSFWQKIKNGFRGSASNHGAGRRLGAKSSDASASTGSLGSPNSPHAPGDGRSCPFCDANPIASPRRMSCPSGHIACYYCVASRLKANQHDAEGGGIECPCCGEKVKGSKPI